MTESRFSVVSVAVMLATALLAVFPARAAEPELEPLHAAESPANDAKSDVIILPVGEQKTYVHARPIQRVAVGDPKIAGITVISGGTLLITGKQAGATSFSIWERGDNKVPDYTARIMVTANAAPFRPVSNLSGLDVKPLGPRFELGGVAASLPQHAAAALAMKPDGKQPVDTSQSGFGTQVQIDIKVVEVSRTKVQDAGFNFLKNTATSVLAITGPSALSGLATAGGTGFNVQSQLARNADFTMGYGNRGILGVINALQQNGMAYTLAEPSLTSMSGQTATFLSGGEIPIPIVNGQGVYAMVTIMYKDYGIKVSLTPTVLDAGHIALKVAPEVSDIDPNLGVIQNGFNIPAFTVRRTDTSLLLGDGESFVISGLVSQSTQAAASRFPGLGDIPIIGAFFRNTHFQRSDKELLMIVTTHLVHPLARDARLPELPGERSRKYDPSFPALMFGEMGKFNGDAPGFSE
ncbi:MAG: type II and III secretion system protein family protein [Betaproteobacteria bacterium]|nr:type II and III secretion system protein family protein [Betaproteobacteria bacterium]